MTTLDYFARVLNIVHDSLSKPAPIKEEPMTTAYTGPTPWDGEMKRLSDQWRTRKATNADSRLLAALCDKAEGYRRGWADAKTEDAPLLEAAKAATAILNIPDDGRFHATEEALLILLAAIAQAEGRDQPASPHP